MSIKRGAALIQQQNFTNKKSDGANGLLHEEETRLYIVNKAWNILVSTIFFLYIVQYQTMSFLAEMHIDHFIMGKLDVSVHMYDH